MENNKERTFKKLVVEVKDEHNILITTVDNDGEKITENHEFEHDCVLTETDKLALAVLSAIGFDAEWIYRSGVLESWVDGDEDNDFMDFFSEEKAKEQSNTLIEEAREALRKEKEEMNRNREKQD